MIEIEVKKRSLHDNVSLDQYSKPPMPRGLHHNDVKPNCGFVTMGPLLIVGAISESQQIARNEARFCAVAADASISNIIERSYRAQIAAVVD